ncbi:hypothetical protein ACF0H5_016835 [Mactra antiquata]
MESNGPASPTNGTDEIPNDPGFKCIGIIEKIFSPINNQCFSGLDEWRGTRLLH